jgi:hypothetical protein
MIIPFSTHARSDMNDVCLQITLRGRVSVAGWRDQRKGVGCAPCGRQQVILPRASRKGVEPDVSKEVHVRTRFVIAKAVREVLDAASGLASCFDLRMPSRLSRAGFRRTGESKRNETKEWNGDNGCYSMCFPVSPFLSASSSFISQGLQL